MTGTRYPELFAALAAPFESAAVKTLPRRGRDGAPIRYVTARTVMNRLDAVLGPENWWNAFAPAGEHSVTCVLTIRLPDGSTLAKQDAGGAAGMDDGGDDEKSAHSDAIKRAAVLFGVGRYLFGDGVPTFHASNANEAPRRDGGGSAGAAPAPAPPPPRSADRAPRSGKDLYRWLKDQDQRCPVGLLKYLDRWGKIQNFPGRIVDWDPDQAALGHAEAVRKLRHAFPNGETTQERPEAALVGAGEEGA